MNKIYKLESIQDQKALAVYLREHAEEIHNLCAQGFEYVELADGSKWKMLDIDAQNESKVRMTQKIEPIVKCAFMVKANQEIWLSTVCKVFEIPNLLDEHVILEFYVSYKLGGFIQVIVTDDQDKLEDIMVINGSFKATESLQEFHTHFMPNGFLPTHEMLDHFDKLVCVVSKVDEDGDTNTGLIL